MNQQELIKIIQTQKAAGKTVEEILSLGANAGFAPVLLKPLVDQIYHGEHTPDHFQNENSGVQFFWDPVLKNVSLDTFHYQKNKHLKFINQANKDPYFFYRTYQKKLKIGQIIFLFSIFIVVGNLFFEVFPANGSGILLIIAGYFFVPVQKFKKLVQRNQKQFLYNFIAQKNNWLSGPAENCEKLKLLENFAPQLFGNQGRNKRIEAELWGSIPMGLHKSQSFYTGLFYYEVGKKNPPSIYKHRFYAFKLEKKHDIKVLIQPDDFSRSLFRSLKLRPQKHEVESTLFNKKFETQITNSQNQKLDTFKYLTPIAQDMLVQLQKQNLTLKVFIAEDTAIFMNDKDQFSFPNIETKKTYTNFLQKIEVDERDVDNITEQIKRIIPIAHAIVDTWD